MAGPVCEMTLAIEVRGLSKRYAKGQLANDAIDLKIEQGSIVAVLGPNGAGKTTLVRQLTGELAPSSGEISLFGVDVVRQPQAAKRFIGVVPQEVDPYPLIKPREQLEIFGQLHGLSRKAATRRAEELIDQLNLRPHVDKLTRQLSGGLKRKLLVGVALMARPPLLILDEPTTGLDPRSRREVWQLVRDVQRDGATVLLTTHYMEEAEALCDFVAVLGNGRVLAQGTVEQVRGLCRNQYRATYESVGGETRTIYGRSQAEVVAAVEETGASEYAIARTSLEEVYLELTSEELKEAVVV